MNVNIVTKILPSQQISIGIKLSENASLEFAKKSVATLKKQLLNFKKGPTPDKVFAINCDDMVRVEEGVTETFIELSKYVKKINGQTIAYYKPKVMTDEVKLFFETIQANITALGISNSVIYDYQLTPEEIEVKFKFREKKRNDILIFIVFLIGIIVVIYGDNLDKFDLTKNIKIKDGKEIITGIKTNVVQIIGVPMVGLGILKLGWAMFSRIIFRKKNGAQNENN